jgi:hypothetical protein
MNLMSWLDEVVPQVIEQIGTLGGWFLPLCVLLFIMLLKFFGARDLPDELPSGRAWTPNSNRTGVDVGHID